MGYEEARQMQQFLGVVTAHVPTLISASEITGVMIVPDDDEDGYTVRIDYRGGRALVYRETLREARAFVMDLVERFGYKIFWAAGIVEE